MADITIDRIDKKYKADEYFLGKKPSSMCYEVLKLKPPTRRLKVLDIGCGEGKDAVFFARNGYDVTGIEISEAGLNKAKRLVDDAGVGIKLIKADIREYRLDTSYDILFSNGVLNCIKPEMRDEIFDNYKKYTSTDGLNVFNIHIDKPFIYQIPGKGSSDTKWFSGEIFTHYHDWLIRDCTEYIFDCNSSGVAHKHAMNRIIAQKIV